MYLNYELVTHNDTINFMQSNKKDLINKYLSK